MVMFLDFSNRVTKIRQKKKVLTFPIKAPSGENTGETATLNLQVNDDLVNNNHVIYRAYVTQRKNERQGTVNTLTRAEVRGGGRKPWKQKGTGRARAGSNRSPLWKGGGVSFGPKPKSYSNKINRKEWRLAMRNLLAMKESNITVVNDINSRSSEEKIQFKTKSFINLFRNSDINFSEKTTFICSEIEEGIFKATRNIKTINLMRADTLNFVKILRSQHLIMSKDSLKIIEETYNG